MSSWCTVEALQGDGAKLQHSVGEMMLQWCWGAWTVPKYGAKSCFGATKQSERLQAVHGWRTI